MLGTTAGFGQERSVIDRRIFPKICALKHRINMQDTAKLNRNPCPDMAGYTLRLYQRSDAENLARLYERSVSYYGPTAYSTAQVKAWAGTVSAEKIRERSGDGRHVIVANDLAGNVLGWVDLEADGHIDFLYIAPEAHGRRLGSRLYCAVEQHARSRSMPLLHVEASELARHLFAKQGFTLIRRNELSVCGVAIHNFSMEKLLA
ncbi:GNAT family N-acetyltransferase [Massilia phyllosphaerae]|uniref:GNAT family N-acetyltransferase n=1 Tax=Massilia phyllosphaerae TaxID=3106034 RepID=UPI002B1CB092|nr:GNAT family N-acetyltransferase [Massilia sp. SGZ-792]